MRVACISFLSLVCLTATLMPRCGLAQAVSDLPRPEYYVAKNLYGAGRTVEAAEGFSSALSRARRIGEVRWIDSIPPLVMLGECYYQQGSLAAALEQYDAALMLALANPGWINAFDAGQEQLPMLDGYAKGIGWFQKSQPTTSAAIPESVQIAIDPTQAQVAPNGVVTAPVSLITRLDATEIFRTMAMAMLRRWQILGPLAKHSPLTLPLSEHFLQSPSQPAIWVQSSWRVLRGIHYLSTNRGIDAPAVIRSGMLLGDQFDYYLTPIALIAMAELNMNEGNFQAAISLLQDAAINAAKFEQHSELSQSLRMLAVSAAVSRRTELILPLQNASDWATKQSGISHVAARIGAAELAIYGNEFTSAKRALDQTALILRNREIVLPRDQAHLFYVRALLSFGQNNRAAGLSSLDSALTLMRGNAKSGAVVETIFQAQMTLDLLASGALTIADAESLLKEILAEPGASNWQKAPLKTLAAITTSSLPAFERLLEMADQRGDQIGIYSRLDRLQRQRFYEALPLGGRLLCLRKAVSTPLANLPPTIRAEIEQTFIQYPAIKNAAERIEAITQQLQNAPLPIGDRVAAPAKKLYAELEQLSRELENQLAFQALLRKPLDRYLPTSANQDVSQQDVKSGDLVLALAVSGNNIFGIAITKDGVVHWKTPDGVAAVALLKQLTSEMGLTRQINGRIPSVVMEPSASWRKFASDLQEHLFPPNIAQMIRDAQRVVLAPSSSLWYVPFELLPVDSAKGAPPWIQDRSVTYVPTLGSYGHAYAGKPNVRDTVGLMGGMFSLDREVNQELGQYVMSSLPNGSTILLDQKNTVLSPTWLRIRTDQLLVATQTMPVGWETIVLPFARNEQSKLASWLQNPVTSPASVILPGLQTSIATGNLGNGNEIFLPACGMLFSGTKSALISRWPVGGRSGASFLKRYMTELKTESPSESLRRTALSLWADDFLIADEPALLPAGKESNELCKGSHPILWSGYMVVGDTERTK